MLKLETNYDNLRLYDGNTSNAIHYLSMGTRLAKLTGSNLPANITSFGNQIVVVFTSDGSVVRPGYRAKLHVSEGSSSRQGVQSMISQLESARKYDLKENSIIDKKSLLEDVFNEEEQASINQLNKEAPILLVAEENPDFSKDHSSLTMKSKHLKNDGMEVIGVRRKRSLDIRMVSIQPYLEPSNAKTMRRQQPLVGSFPALSVIIHPNHLAYPGMANVGGIRTYIHGANEGFDHADGLDVGANMEVLIRLEHHEDKTCAASKDGEHDHHSGERYSCKVECEAKLLNETCGCLPYLLSHNNMSNNCNYDGLKCVIENNGMWYRVSERFLPINSNQYFEEVDQMFDYFLISKLKLTTNLPYERMGCDKFMEITK